MAFSDRHTRNRLLAAGFVAASLAFLLVIDVSGPPQDIAQNPALLEARSILDTGSVVLPERLHDTAIDDDRALNIFQPGQTLLFLSQLALFHEKTVALWKGELFVTFIVSAVLLAVALTVLAGGSSGIGTALAASGMFGAPYIASLPKALTGSVHRANHVFAIPFIAATLLLLGRRLTPRRLWLIGACIGSAMAFRAQNVLLLIIPLCLLFQDEDGIRWDVARRLRGWSERRRFVQDLVRLAVFPCAAILLIALFNVWRFGSPFESGYLAIYDGRIDYLAQQAHEYGLWSLHFLPANLWRTLFAFPSMSFSGLRVVSIAGDPFGNSLLFSQPVLLLTGVLFAKGAFPPRVQAFLLGAILLSIPVLTYHNAGLEAPGYMRYSLDYLFVWIAVIAVAFGATSHARPLRTATWLLAAWAVYYGIAVVRVLPTP
jgi:hypothetical protein